MSDPQSSAESEGSARQRRRVWELHGAGRRMLIIHRRDSKPEDRYERNPAGIGSALSRWLSDSFSSRTVLQLYEVVSGHSVSSFGLNDPDQVIKPRLEEAFRRGELLILELKKPAQGQPEAPPEQAQPQRNAPKQNAPPSKEKTWIEFRVVWPDGKPAAGVAYKLKITDGSIRTGTLDSEGSVRVANIDPGSCDFSLTDVDGRCWKPA